ncbi:MAG: ATPase domain-containing protein [Nitrososphaerales archaeon]
MEIPKDQGTQSNPREAFGDVSLIAVSKEMDMTKSLIVILRKMLVEDKNSALLVLSSVPSEQFLLRAKEFGFDMQIYLKRSQLLLIDCITKFTQEGSTPLLRDVFYAASPSDLSDISLKVSEALASKLNQGEKWMVLDSITTLSLYNTSGGILRFMQFLFRKLRLLNFDGTMIVVRDEAQDSMIQSLKQYCSKLIFIAPTTASG